VVGGECNEASNIGAIVVGGTSNVAYGINAFIGGGHLNNIASNSCNSVILNGRRNTVYPLANFSTILSGDRNNIQDITYNFIAGGTANTILDTSRSGRSNLIGIGTLNVINGGRDGVILNGSGNTICTSFVGDRSFIGTGFSNISCFGGVIVSGYSNILKGRSFLGVGAHNSIVCGFGGLTERSIVGPTSDSNSQTPGSVCSAIVSGYANLAISYSGVGGATGATSSNLLSTPFSPSFIGNGFFNSSIGFIGSGVCNTAYGIGSSILNGVSNTISRSSWTPNSTGVLNAPSCFNTIIGGTGNVTGLLACASFNVIGGGAMNRTTGCLSTILNGCFNTISDADTGSIILGGTSGFIGYLPSNPQKSTAGNIIGLGSSNSIIGGFASNIINGACNLITAGSTGTPSSYSFIGSGVNNTITCCSQTSYILTGSSNTIIRSSGSAVGSGGSNRIYGNQGSIIVSGAGNAICREVDDLNRDCYNTLLSGCGNTILTSSYSSISNGSYNTVTCDYALAGGVRSLVNRYGQRSYSSAPLSIDPGSFQTMDLMLSRISINIGAGYMYMDGAVAAQIFQIPISANRAMAFSLNVSR
jgi:hypothetical protein